MKVIYPKHSMPDFTLQWEPFIYKSSTILSTIFHSKMIFWKMPGFWIFKIWNAPSRMFCGSLIITLLTSTSHQSNNPKWRRNIINCLPFPLMAFANKLLRRPLSEPVEMMKTTSLIALILIGGIFIKWRSEIYRVANFTIYLK